MDLKSIRAKKDELARYMLKEITYICQNLGKRDPGSEGEKQACEYMAKVLKEKCGCEKVSVESFEENPGSFYGWIYITITCCFLAFAAFMAGLAAGIAALYAVAIVLIVFGLALAVFQFGMYKKTVDFLFPKKTGHNVTAIKKCSGETKRRLIFNGHPDAAWEWPVNYALGGVGFESHAIICALGAVYVIVISAIALAGNADPILLKKLGLGTIAFMPFWVGLYFMWNKHRVVDGANDNLSGCYMGIAVLKALKDAGIELENTELGVVLSGSEEAGLRGAKAWCEAHKGEFDDVPTFIFSYDTIHDPKQLMVNYRDLNGTVKADKDVSDLFLEAAQDLGIFCKTGMVPPLGGATDSAAFAQAGFRATGVTGLNHKLESYYHTRKDTYTNMDLKGLADCYEVSVRALEMFDDGAKQ
ncbi:MAG: M20/M25/M40 family metallo-hydrolase [Clostridia bacterium]|nr:M20/M25/M40 family metallo-hydrolase [Clostridia bacterium]